MTRSTFRPGRAAALATLAAAVPAAGGAVHPALSTVLAGLEGAVGLTIMATALFGSDRLSERAFRLLRWIADRPEPSKRSRR
ncbi:hypothetical protein GCM10009530_21960 [Microbispora corallina]|uniref:Uncharacterized protein n=1 Tax=Microbispora corallina TaxID=83302 RepID=A0ABQ4G633_9ACTN|nr:hypothetical protein [Microbispora corallina]GIH42538.1 hypothetical protein Mco01_55380 [Microbispora corallina]